MITDTRPITAAQARWLRAIYRHMMRHGAAPTRRELCAAMGRSLGRAQGVVRALAARGYVAVARQAPHPAQRGPDSPVARGLTLPGAPLRFICGRLAPAVEPWTEAGRLLLGVLAAKGEGVA